MLERIRFRAMGCPCVLHLYASSRPEAVRIADAAVAEVHRLEAKYSRYREDSLASAINRSAGDPRGIAVDEETAGLLDYAATCHAHSEGRFDITSGVLRRVWDFRSGRVPSAAEVDAVRPLIGWERVLWARPRLVLPRPGMELDFGGYVKEYAVDRVAELCRGLGVEHGLVDLGGDLAVVGPHPDGRPWTVGIRDPGCPAEAITAVSLASGAIATSGDYERGMVVDGVRYTHVLDPRTGWPVEGLASVSVMAPHCLVAGSASTIAMLLGAEAGDRWLEALGLPSLRIDRDGVRAGALAAATAGPGTRPAARAETFAPA
jgi:thiamine biosynthesis lipoprotein